MDPCRDRSDSKGVSVRVHVPTARQHLTGCAVDILPTPGPRDAATVRCDELRLGLPASELHTGLLRPSRVSGRRPPVNVSDDALLVHHERRTV